MVVSIILSEEQILEIRETTDTESQIFHDAMNIRLTVFVKEQNVPEELERDEFDNVSHHFVGYQDGQPVTTVRIKKEDQNWHVQRVATMKDARGHGYAQQLMEEIIKRAKLEPGINYLVLGAQLTAILFYEKIGFKAVGPEFTEAGILHREMKLAVK